MTPERLRELASALPFSPRADLGTVALQTESEQQETRNALRAYAALLEAKAPPEARGDYELAWLIEGRWSSTAYPEYWVGSSAWSSDPYKALRFATKESAQQAADMMLVGINHRVAFHEFAGNANND